MVGVAGEDRAGAIELFGEQHPHHPARPGHRTERKDHLGLREHARRETVRPTDQKDDLRPALVLLAKVVNGADTDNTLWNQPESAGLNAIAEGFRHLGYKDDHESNAAEWVVYDALYAYCREMVGRGKPDGAFK